MQEKSRGAGQAREDLALPLPRQCSPVLLNVIGDVLWWQVRYVQHSLRTRCRRWVNSGARGGTVTCHVRRRCTVNVPDGRK